MKTFDLKNSKNYRKHRRQISDILSNINNTFKTSIIEDTKKSIKKPFEELFEYKFFWRKFYKMGFILDMN